MTLAATPAELRPADQPRLRFFDTISVQLPGPTEARAALLRAKDAGYNLCDAGGGTVQVACDETTTTDHLRDVVAALVGASRVGSGLDAADVRADRGRPGRIPGALTRTSKFLTHPVFSAHRSETAMLRYLRRLSDLDVALDRVDDPARLLHDEAERGRRDGGRHAGPSSPTCTRSRPRQDAAGYAELIGDLERWLCAVTGYDAVLGRAERRLAGRARRAARDPRLPRVARRRRARRLPDPRVRARHQRRAARCWPGCGSSW